LTADPTVPAIVHIVHHVHFTSIGNILITVEMPIGITADKAGTAVTSAVAIRNINRADFSTDTAVIVIVPQVHTYPVAFYRIGSDTDTLAARTVLVDRARIPAAPTIADISKDIPA
jgi:hypothetical protein